MAEPTDWSQSYDLFSKKLDKIRQMSDWRLRWTLRWIRKHHWPLPDPESEALFRAVQKELLHREEEAVRGVCF